MTTLKELAQEAKAIQDEARHIWPGYELPPIAAKFIGKNPRHNWQFHLTQMLLSDDPVKYLRDNSPNEILYGGGTTSLGAIPDNDSIMKFYCDFCKTVTHTNNSCPWKDITQNV